MGSPKVKPRRSGCKPGLLGLASWCGGADPPRCERITTSPPTACLGHHCAVQNRRAKKRRYGYPQAEEEAALGTDLWTENNKGQKILINQ
jgi:hypothetical protein